MAARTDAAQDAHRARLAERAPSGGWRVIASKEIGDHVSSVRFYVLLVIIGLAAVIPLYFAADVIRNAAPQASGQPAVFLALFVIGSDQLAGIPVYSFVALLGPLLGIAFGFDAVNSERSQGTLPRLLSQPIHRDDVINGKFTAGLTVIGLMLVALTVLVAAFGMLRLALVPEAEEVVRLVLWLAVTILYVGFWLAFGTLLSVVVRRAASAALIGFGIWFALIVLGSIIVPVVAGFLFPIPSDGTIADQLGARSNQQLFLRLFPQQLYADAIRAILNPGVTTVVGPTNLAQAFSASEQVPSLLPVDQSLLLVWPQIVGLVALTVVTFALAYVLFLRQEVRA
ncbi:MAG: ABC transporter permease [Chloroflexota bacterium]